MELSQILFNHFKQNGLLVRKSLIPYMEAKSFNFAQMSNKSTND